MATPSPTLQIAPCFAVPMAMAKHPDPEPLNRELRALFLAREGEGERHRNPQPSMRTTANVFESEFRLFESTEPCLVKLREFCLRSLSTVVGQLNDYDAEHMRRLKIFVSAWFHVTRQGGQFGVHNHAMASWSGVYCVDTGDGAQPRADSGLLSFVNPAATAAMFLDLSLTNIKQPFTTQSREFKLEAGDLIIFPSWLLHQVTPHYGPTERITTAFNAWFKLDPAAAAAVEPGATFRR